MEQYEEYQKKIEGAFKAVSDPVTNERVFEIILKKLREPELLLKTSNFGGDQEKKRRGIERDFHAFSKDAGDVLVVTIPGYNLDFNAGTGIAVGDFFQPSTFFGLHGHDPRLPEMKAIFYAAGPNFKRKSLENINNVDVAPTVAEILGIDPPKDSQGKKIRTEDK